MQPKLIHPFDFQILLEHAVDISAEKGERSTLTQTGRSVVLEIRSKVNNQALYSNSCPIVAVNGEEYVLTTAVECTTDESQLRASVGDEIMDQRLQRPLDVYAVIV